MQDVSIQLEDRPGSLAHMGSVLGNAGISIEGGGAWIVKGNGAAHFLFQDGEAARIALEQSGIEVLAVRDVVMPRLLQGTPGQLGMLTKKMAEAGVNIEVLYSDHAGNLVLVVDQLEEARAVCDTWMNGRM